MASVLELPDRSVLPLSSENFQVDIADDHHLNVRIAFADDSIPCKFKI